MQQLETLLSLVNSHPRCPGHAISAYQPPSLSSGGVALVPALHDRFEVWYFYMKMVEKKLEKERDEHCEQFWKDSQRIHAMLEEIVSQHYPPAEFDVAVQAFAHQLDVIFPDPQRRFLDSFLEETRTLARPKEKVSVCWAQE